MSDDGGLLRPDRPLPPCETGRIFVRNSMLFEGCTGGGSKDMVKDNLAGYKVPQEIAFVDELPRNAAGKVLKRELEENNAG